MIKKIIISLLILTGFNLYSQENIDKMQYDSLISTIKTDKNLFTNLVSILDFSDSTVVKYKELINIPYDSIDSKAVSVLILKLPEYKEIQYMQQFQDDESFSVNKKVIALTLNNLYNFSEWIKADSSFQQKLLNFKKAILKQNKSVRIDDIAGIYEKVEISSFKIKDKDTIPDWDTIQFILKKDSSFIFKWSPMYGKYSDSHIYSTGKWCYKDFKIIFNTKYQQDEYRVFEYFKPEFGDTITKIYVQTYDSLVGFFEMQFVNVLKDSIRYPFMIFPDPDFPKQRCLATFNLPNVDKISVRGDFGQMPIIEPKNKKANCIIIQYNWSTNWDYQYMKDLKWDYTGNELSIMTNYGDRIILQKK